MRPVLSSLLCLMAVLGGFACAAPSSVPAPAASAPPAPAADAVPRLDLDALARAVQARGNEARRDNGASALEWSDSLATLARVHSEDMAARGFFEHTNPDGVDVNGRGQALGMSCAVQIGNTTWRGFSENLLYTGHYSSSETTRFSDGRETTTYAWKSADRIAREAVASWLNSPGHRANLLQPRSRRAGVGIAVSANQRVYLTHVFC